MSITLFLCLWLGVLVFVAGFATLSITLNLRLRRRYPSVYEAVGKPRLFSRYPDFLWELPAHRAVLSEGDWRLRTWLVWLHGLGVVAALAVAIWSAWDIFTAHPPSRP